MIDSNSTRASSRIKRNLMTLHPGSAMWSGICWTAWILLVYSGEWFGKETGATPTMNTDAYLFSTTALAVVFVLLGLKPDLGKKLLANNAFMLAAGLVASGGTLLLILAGNGLIPFPLFYPGNIMTGIGTALIGMKTAVWFSGNPTRAILFNTGLSVFGAMLLFSFTLAAPGLIPQIILVALPFVAVLLGLISMDLSLDLSLDTSTTKSGKILMPRHFWRFVVGIFLLMVSLSLVRGYYPNFLLAEEFSLSRDYTAVGCTAIAMAFVIIAVFAPKGFSVGKLCYWISVGTALMFAVLPVVGLGSFVTGSTFAIASAAIFISVWCLMACISFKSGASALTVVGFGFVSVAFGSAAGWWLGDYMYMTVPENVLMFISVALIVIVLAVCLILFRQGDLEAMAVALDDDQDENVIGKDHDKAFGEPKKPRFRLRIESLAKEKGLSERETEVFSLLARGRSARGIAEELVISYNTARVHVSNVYAKFEVHSKDELQHIIEDGRDVDQSSSPELKAQAD